MSLTPKPTGADVRDYRIENECSLFEANHILRKKWRREQLQLLASRCSAEMDQGNAAAYIIADLIEVLQESDQ